MKYYDTDALLLLKEEAFEEKFAIGVPTIYKLTELGRTDILEMIAKHWNDVVIYETMVSKDEYIVAKTYHKVLADKDDVFVTGSPANYILGKADGMHVVSAVKKKHNIYNSGD